MSTVQGVDLLAAITAAARRSAAARARRRPYGEVEAAAAAHAPDGAGFRAALVNGSGPRVIAECKRRSPSRGVLRAVYDPAGIAEGYQRAGAVAVSVLTEPTFFDGDLAHLRRVRARVAVPLLCKDFVVSAYQVLEAREAGADAVLLIAAALPADELQPLVALANRQGLAALVEVHDELELDRAIDAGAAIVGVNSRDLRTLTVDLDVTRRLGARLPASVVGVAESGLKTRVDLDELAGLGYQAFLVGERLMAAPDPGRALADLLGSPGAGGVRGE